MRIQKATVCQVIRNCHGKGESLKVLQHECGGCLSSVVVAVQPFRHLGSDMRAKDFNLTRLGLDYF